MLHASRFTIPVLICDHHTCELFFVHNYIDHKKITGTMLSFRNALIKKLYSFIFFFG